MNLDKPAAVAACAAGIGGPCRDHAERDAAEALRDGARGVDAGADTGPIGADGRGGFDGPAAVDDAGRSDSAQLPGLDLAAATDARPADATLKDLQTADDLAADRPVDLASPDAPPGDGDGGLDASASDVIDAATSPVDKPVTAEVTDTAAASDIPVDVADTAIPPDKPDVVTSVVSFKSGRGDGIMTGYGWVTLGASDTVTSPTCGSANLPITSAAPCATVTNWNSPTALCLSGTIPALPEVPSATDYANNWGVQVGVNAKEPNASIGQSFITIALDVSGSPISGLRIELHRAGDAVGATYCALWTSSDPVPLTSFNTECWNNNGVFLTAADVLAIDKVGLQVTSGSVPITVTNLCIQSIVFGR